MGKFHLFWRLNETTLPVDAKERGGGWGLLMAMIKQDMDNGLVKDWGAFTSEGRGYCIVEGTTLDVMKMTEQYNPYVFFEVKPVSPFEEVNELIQHLTGK